MVPGDLTLICYRLHIVSLNLHNWKWLLCFGKGLSYSFPINMLISPRILNIFILIGNLTPLFSSVVAS